MKNKFRYVNEIRFKDRTYAIFDNGGYKVFLRKLEADDFEDSADFSDSIKSTKLVYTDLEEFKELNKIFNHKLELINAMIEDRKEDNEEPVVLVIGEAIPEDEETENFEIALEKGKLYKFPVKIYDNGEFISLAQAIDETGFGIARKSENYFENEEEIEEIFNNEEELFNSKNIVVEETSNGEYRIKSITENPEYADSVFIETNEEFSSITGINNPSYDEIKEAVNNNSNLEEKYLEIIINGLDKLKEKNINFDLSVLYYNLSRLQVEEVNEETQENQTLATFNPTDGIVSVKMTKWDELSAEELLKMKYTFLHEVLGHGCTEAYIDNSFKSVTYSLITPIEDDEGQMLTVDMINYGDAFREAIADMVALNAMDDSEKNLITYKPYFMELDILLKVLNYNLGDLIDRGVWGLKDVMIENGIKNPEQYIDRADTSKMSIATSDSVSERFDIQSDIVEMLNQVIDNNMQSGSSREDAIIDIVGILDNETIIQQEEAFENIISPISIANIKKGIINEIEEKA